MSNSGKPFPSYLRSDANGMAVQLPGVREVISFLVEQHGPSFEARVRSYDYSNGYHSPSSKHNANLARFFIGDIVRNDKLRSTSKLALSIDVTRKGSFLALPRKIAELKYSFEGRSFCEGTTKNPVVLPQEKLGELLAAYCKERYRAA